MPIWRGTTSTDWNTASNWVVDSLGNSGVPTSTTDAIFDATSTNPCTTGAVARDCRDLITTGFTNTLTIGSTSAGVINVFRNVTLGTSTNHLDPTNSLANINIRTSGITITSASSSVIVPGITNQLFSQTINLVGTISILRFAPVGGAVFNSSTAGTFIEIVNGGSLQGGGGPGTNVTVRINGSCSINSGGYSTRGAHVLASGSTLTMNGFIDVNNTTTSFDFSPGTLIPGTQLFRMQNPAAVVTLNMGTNSLYDMTIIGTLALQSNLNITRNLAASLTTALSGAFDITVGGNMTGGSITNSTNNRKIKITGTATGTSTVTNFSFGAGSGLTYTFEIDCGSNNFVIAGTTTIVGGTVVIDYLTSNSGTFTTTGSILSYTAGNLSLNMTGRGSSYSWGTLQNPGGVSRAVTLLSDVYFQTIGTTTTSVWNGAGYSLYVFGSAGTMGTTSGTATLKFIGSSNATWTVTAGNTISLFGIAFERTGGTLNIPNSFIYTGTGGITWTSGAINHTATLTLGTTILNTSSVGMSWNSLTINAGVGITINQPLLVTNNLTLLGTSTFTGSAGWTCANLLCSTAASTLTLANNTTYRTTTSASLLGTSGSRITMISNLAASRSIWTLDYGANQSLTYVNGTRIDSSQGQTVWTFGGTVSTTPPATLNWNVGTRPGTISYTFVN
jgi:hypothetical protein